MSYDGTGTYSLPSPEYPAIPGTIIKSTDFNTIMADLQTALSLCMVRDGQSLATGAFNMNGKKISGLAAGTVAGDAVRFEQLTAALTALGALTPAADKFPYFTGATTADMLTIVAAIRTVLASADVATMRTNLGLLGAAICAVGTGAGDVAAGNHTHSGVYQPADADLTAIAGLTSAADKGIQFTGAGTAGTFDLTTAGKALLDDATVADQRTTLGLGTAALTNTGTGDGNVPVLSNIGGTIKLPAVDGSLLTGLSAIPADDSVTLAKMAHGTAGNLITYDAAGAPAAVATGIAGQVLTSGGAGVAPTFAALGGTSTSVSLPYTEGTADANTFVCEFNSATDHTNETGVGLGLSGANLVLTQVGSVDGATADGRPILVNNQGFTATAACLAAWMGNGVSYSFLMKFKTNSTYSNGYMFYLTNNADADLLSLTTGDNSTYAARHENIYASAPGRPQQVDYFPTPLLSVSTTYWFAMWANRGWNYAGIMPDAGSGVPPTGWGSFASGRRVRYKSYPGWQNTSWASTPKLNVVGFASGASSALMTVGTLILSKLSLGVPSEWE